MIDCHECLNRHECELFSHVCECEIEYCRDYVQCDEYRAIFRREWFESAEDAYGEYDPDGFSW